MFAWLYKMLGRPVPYYAHYSIILIIWKILRKWLNVSIIPFIPFNGLRIIGYKFVGYKIGKKVFFP